MYETPGGTILLQAHRGIELITLDRGAAHLKDELMPRYAELIDNGFWFSPEREMLQAAIDKSQEMVSGDGAPQALQGRRPADSAATARTALRPGLVTFEEGAVAIRPRRGGLHQAERAGLRTLAKRRRKSGG